MFVCYAHVFYFHITHHSTKSLFNISLPFLPFSLFRYLDDKNRLYLLTLYSIAPPFSVSRDIPFLLRVERMLLPKKKPQTSMSKFQAQVRCLVHWTVEQEALF